VITDFKVIDEAIAEIGRKTKMLDEITTLTQTINSNSTKVLDKLRATKESMERQILLLNEHLEGL
jgi:hypothetical protein